MLCSNCNAYNDNDALFCTHCGKKLLLERVNDYQDSSIQNEFIIRKSDSCNKLKPEELIRKILSDNNLENYIPVFEENHLFDLEVLESMTEEDFLSIGISILGDRRKLILLVKKIPELSILYEQTENNDNEVFINVSKNGKSYCVNPCKPNDLLCKKCHHVVAEESTLCWYCNNSLIEN